MKKILNKAKHKYRVVKSVIREKAKSKKRSSQWDETRDAFILENPKCAACDSINNLQVHHILPFKLYPELELDKNNLITLCMSDNECHLLLGHFNNFSLFNEHIKEHAVLFRLSNQEQRNLLIEHIKKNKNAKHS